MTKTHLALAAVLLTLVAGAGSATASGDHDAGATAAFRLTLVDTAGVRVSGACFELYAAAGLTYGVLVDTFCNTSGESQRLLPEGAYVLREVAPPLLLLPPGAPAERHVYRKAGDARFSITAPLATHVTLEHELGAAIEVHATLPDGGDANASCFAARGAGSSQDPGDAGAVVDEACSGTGATATLYVAGGDHVVSQATGPAGFAFAADAHVPAVVDDTVQVELRMRTAPVLRIEQRAADGRLVPGGCYSVDALPDGGPATFVRYVCDHHDAEDRDGVVVAEDLPAGRYRLHEETAPEGFRPAQDATVVLGRADVTVTQTHERLPYVLVTTTGAESGTPVTGSCWLVRFPGDREAIAAEACDADDGASDGTTRLTTLTPGAWELRHTVAPAGWARVGGATPFTLADEDLELAFALTGPSLPRNTAAPGISGDPRIGLTLSGAAGAWTGTSPISFAHRWERCDASGSSCVPIAGATASAYAVVPADMGHTLRLAVTATNIAGSAVARSVPTAAVDGAPPVSLKPPAVVGEARLGAEQLATPGTWAGAQPIALAYQWERCAADGSACAAVPGATGEAYVPVGLDHYRATLRVAVTASNADGEAVARSAPTPLLLAPPRNLAVPEVLDGDDPPLLVGRRLSGLPGTWTGAPPLARAPQWLRCDVDGDACVQVDGATEWSYAPQLSDLGGTLRLRVTATNGDGTAGAESAPTAIVTALPPRSLELPRVLGGQPLRLGADLLGEPGTWVGTRPLAYTPQWLRCDETGVSCLEIPEANGWSYTVSRADVRSTLRLRVTATNVAGTVTALSQLTGALGASPPRNVVPPLVTGIALPGEPLRGFAGTWVGAPPIDLAPQWLRCDAFGDGCDAIPAAAGWSYVTSLADRGHTIRLAVTAANADGTTTARSAHTGIVPGTVPGPTSLEPPRILGAANGIHLGLRLTGDRGNWSGTWPIAYAPQWLRCDAYGELCLPIAGGTAWSYTVGRSDVGHRIRLAVTATNADGSVTARSVPTAFLAPAPPVNLDPPVVWGDLRVGGRLRGYEGSWMGARPMTFAPRWLRCSTMGDACVPIPGATAWSYVPTAADAAGTLRLEVAATNADGSGVARTHPLYLG